MSHSIPHVLGTRPSAGLLTSNPVHMQEASLTKYSHAKSCQQTQLCLFSKKKKKNSKGLSLFTLGHSFEKLSYEREDCLEQGKKHKKTNNPQLKHGSKI